MPGKQGSRGQVMASRPGGETQVRHSVIKRFLSGPVTRRRAVTQTPKIWGL